MFSRRLEWPVRVNRLARLLEERRARAAEVIDLTASNPTRAGLEYPVEAIRAAVALPGIADYDPSPRGLPEARAAVAAWYRERGGHSVAPDRIVLTASTSEAYAILFKLLADPGDAVLVPRPGYPLFDFLAGLEAVRLRPYPLAYDDRFRVDVDEVERAADTACRAVVVVNPNNPTGNALRPDELATLDAAAARRGMAIIADEVFFEYPGPGSNGVVSALASEGRALTFVLGGLSKSCGLPQLKLGWIAVRGPEALAGEAMERLDLIADTYLSPGAPVQRGAAALLRLGGPIRAGIARRVDGNRAALAAAVGGSPACRVLPSDGGWYAVVQVPALSREEELVEALLEKDGVLVHPGYFFDFPREAYLVLSLLPEPAEFREGVRRILLRAGRAAS